MRYLWIGAAVAAVALLLVFAFRAADGGKLRAEIPQPPDPPECGGSDDYTDPDAPKTIRSAEIRSFFCSVSLLAEDTADYPLLQNTFYELSAECGEDGAVRCTRFFREGEKEEFSADAAFPARLQALVAQYDLAQYNGQYHKTHGLPDDFGVTLRILYASGEKISSSDNQGMFLPLAAVNDLVRLFYEETDA